ncbi:MAG: response regulator, partial [Gallionellaceae bacterium]
MAKGESMAKGIPKAQIRKESGKADTALRHAQAAEPARIIILSERAGQRHELAAILAAAGYQAEVLTQFDDFSSLCSGPVLPAAVILDLKLQPGESALARTLDDMQTQCQHSVPVIFLSIHTDIAARLAAYRAGATHYLPKPVERARLLELIAESLLLKPAAPYRVLLVGNESTQHAQMLRAGGMEVRIISDSLRVPQKLLSFAAEVLLLDMEMAQCRGPELALLLRDEPLFASIPIIYLTTKSELLLQVNTHSVQSENYLSKLVAPEPLLEVVSEHARSYRHHRAQTAALSVTRYELERQQQAIDFHAIVSVTDVSGKIVFANEKFCQVSRYSSDELIGQNHRMLKSGQHPAAFYEEMWHCISAGNIWHGEVCNRRKDGTLYWVDSSIVPFVDEEGLPYQYISIRTDITHVKENEQRLRRSQAFANIGI